jgi:hypothetical protein
LSRRKALYAKAFPDERDAFVRAFMAWIRVEMLPTALECQLHHFRRAGVNDENGKLLVAKVLDAARSYVV